MPLIERSSSVLVVVDVQDNFLDKLAFHERSTLVSRIGWLMQVATVLDIPMIATIEDVSDKIDMNSTVKALLPNCLLYTSPSPRDLSTSRMPSSA